MIKDKIDYAMMIDRLNEATIAYDAGEPIMSDKAWDELYFEVEEFEKKTGIVFHTSPTQKVNYEIVNELKKVKHNHFMSSLAKTKDWDEFLKYFYNKDPFKDVVGTVKLDGLTCSLHYIDGKLIGAETRGNGEIGEDVLHNALVVKNIPNKINYMDELIVDGEIICTYKDFEPFKEEYSNPRNFAAGSIRLLDSKECAARNLTFVVWNVVKGFPESNSFMNNLRQVEKLGFTVTPWTSSFDWDAAEFLENKAKKLGYPLDGLVGRFDDIAFGDSLGATGHHINAAYAFKFYDDEYETELLGMEWTMGRTGILTPVAIFEPVNDGVSVIERASLHNVSVMKQVLGKPFYRQAIKVIKANMIIPQITWGGDGDGTPFNIPKVCPICGKSAELVESDSGTINLVCTNPHCNGKIINQLDHFCGKKGLDIKGLSLATLEKLIDWGWINSLSDIFTLENYAQEWMKKSGFGAASVNKVLTSINNSKICNLANFISALGIPEIGITVAKELAKHFKTWSAFRDAIDNQFKFYSLPNFGIVMHQNLLNYDFTEADKISKYLTFNEVETTSIVVQENIGTFCITGKLIHFKNRNALQTLIEQYGGKVVGSVTNKVSYLINNDVNSNSAKNQTAKRLNIPIISEEEFIQKFNIDIK